MRHWPLIHQVLRQHLKTSWGRSLGLGFSAPDLMQGHGNLLEPSRAVAPAHVSVFPDTALSLSLSHTITHPPRPRDWGGGGGGGGGRHPALSSPRPGIKLRRSAAKKSITVAQWVEFAASLHHRPGFDPDHGCLSARSFVDSPPWSRGFSPGAPVSSHTPKTCRFAG